MPSPYWNAIMNPLAEARQIMTRRSFFRSAHFGLGSAALATLLANEAVARDAPGVPHFAPKAKRVVYLLQGGAPSHVDLFDYKEELYRHRGEELPASVHMGQRLTTMTAGQKNRPLL